jgi:hypothetical protein
MFACAQQAACIAWEGNMQIAPKINSIRFSFALDVIGFDPVSVPKPSSLVLCATAFLGLAWRRRSGSLASCWSRRLEGKQSQNSFRGAWQHVLDMRLRLRAASLAGLTLLLALQIPNHATAGTLYASSFINGSDHLFVVDPNTGGIISSVVVNAGPIFGPLTAPADLAFAADGTLFASSFINGSDHLFVVDPNTGGIISSVVVNAGPVFGPLTAPADIAFVPNPVFVTVPEPESIVLLGFALVGLAVVTRRNSKLL